MTAALLSGREERELLRVTLADGSVHTGRYMLIGRRHFVVCRDPKDILGRADGPLEERDLVAIEVLQTQAEARAEARQWLMGDRIPGPEPVTRDDYENRLGRMAHAMATTSREEWQGEMQILRQFNELADQIKLAAAKRQWILNEERWRLRSNREPTMADIWVGSTASPSRLARPRPQVRP